eukprot:scaffold166212_cov28-Tisochrysis_lutea.AAC.3
MEVHCRGLNPCVVRVAWIVDVSAVNLAPVAGGEELIEKALPLQMLRWLYALQRFLNELAPHSGEPILAYLDHAARK